MSTDDLEDRLRRLGQTPIAPEVEASHRRAMTEAVAAPAPARARFGWRAVALAAVAGFLVGSTGLAAAGSLPAPAQDVAHDVLDVVGIGVPRSTEGCPEGTSYRNHGEYVSAVEAAGGDVDAAAHSDCGKPTHAAKGNGNGTDKEKEKGAPGASPDGDEDPCTGPPPWAGTHLDPEAKEAARAERETTCGPDDDADEIDDVEEEDPASKRDATTTTVPDATTTTLPSETTTTTEATTTTTTTQP